MANDAGPILVVDDDEDGRSRLSSLLEAAGFGTAEAATGEAAIPLARETEPILALVDVYLPGLSGYEVCHRLKSEFGPSFPVVLVSRARRRDLDQVAGALLGADDCVSAPVTSDELLPLLERLLVAQS